MASIDSYGLGRYSAGMTVSGRVRRLLEHGAEVVLEDGTPAVIRKRELRWGTEPQHPDEVLSEGEAVQALVLKADKERGRLELSLRQAQHDPWKHIVSRYGVGIVALGKVVRLSRRGVFVDLEPAVDAFVPLEEIAPIPPERIEDLLWVGDTVEGVIIRIDRYRRRVRLSLRQRQQQVLEAEESAEQEAFLQQDRQKEASLAEALDAESYRALMQVLRNTQAGSEAQALSEGEARIGGIRRILLSDDDASFRSSLHRLLARIGYEVVAVGTAERAVELATAEDFDLVLMDLGFTKGEMNGVEAVERILGAKPSAQIVVVAGIAWLERNVDALERVRELGARSALLKPVTLGQLEAVMRAIATGKEAWGVAQMPGRLGQSVHFVTSTPEADPNAANLDSLIAARLSALQRATGAAAVILFHMERASGDISVLAHAGPPLRDYSTAKYSLGASPVSDVIHSRQPLLESDVSRNPARFRYLRLVDFVSCIGVPVESLGPPEHALFLFHPKSSFFSTDHLRQAETEAAVLGAALARQQAERIVQRLQPFVFIGQLGSVLVHEINNVLSSVISTGRLLQMDCEKLERNPGAAMEPGLRDELCQCSAKVVADSRRMGDLVRFYLGLGRREESGPTNVNDVVRQAMRVLEPKAAESRVRMLTRLQDEMPLTMTVGTRLEQVFINIMLNAVQQTHQFRGEGLLVVSTSFQPGDGNLPIKVRFSDNGPGIHGQHLQRIGELGFSTRSEGTGLGLFISHGLMESLGGKVTVESNIRLVGTTFCVELPLVVPFVEGVRT